MGDYQVLASLAAFAFLYSIVASRLEQTPVNGALVFVLSGAVCGPFGLQLVDLQIDDRGISWWAELTLAVVLFTDSTNADLGVLRRFEMIPQRLLLVGLPLTIAIGFGVAWLLFGELGWFELALLAALLAPTDAALGQPVLTNPHVPRGVRESLNVESGLNDGICVPVVLLFLSLATGDVAGTEAGSLAMFLAFRSIGIGALVGVSAGLVGSFAVRWTHQRGWIAGPWGQLPLIALALFCFGFAQWLGGSGFIASFVGGMVFGMLTRDLKSHLLEAGEGTGNALSMLTWFTFGALLLSHLFVDFDGRVIVYAIASLTVVRMAGSFLSLVGLGLRTDTKLFLGWFGPRGLASIVFVVMVVDKQVPGADLILTTTSWTILLSVIAHGLSANPLSRLYSSRVGDQAI